MTASIVGWAHTPFGKFDTETVESLVVRVATEALFLHARYVFDDLGYRRFEWKCNSENAKSRVCGSRS